MRIYGLIIICSFFIATNGFTQSRLFDTNGSFKKAQTDVYVLIPNLDEISSISKNRPDQLTIEIPIGIKGIKTLTLEQRSAFTEETIFVERHDKGSRPITTLEVLHYSGKVKGTKNSIVSLSIFKNEILGLISFENQNWNLVKNKTSNNYDLFHDDNVQQQLSQLKFCDSTDGDVLGKAIQQSDGETKKSTSAISTVDVYIECDYQLFMDLGSDVTNTLNFATGMLNTVNTLYNLADIQLNVTQIVVWSTPDPYGGYDGASTSEAYHAFRCSLDGVYNGRIAHLLSSASPYGGLAIGRDYCPYEEALYGVSRISTSYNADINVYSWPVQVVAHEIGHNLSSPHTHACVWNGNNTQIDDCGNVHLTSNNSDSDCDGVIDNVEEAQGSNCFDILNPIIPTKGTIMSYCHISSGNGVDFSTGFHPQVAAKMKNYIDNCLSATKTIYCPMPHETDIIVDTSDPTQLELTCTITSGIDGYAWRISPDYSCAADTTIVTTSNTLIYQNVSLNFPYRVKCALNCVTGPEWGDWSCEIEFVSPKCYIDRHLSGIQSDVLKIEKASNLIESSEMIIDNSRIGYQYSNVTHLIPGFELEYGSIFEVLAISCL